MWWSDAQVVWREVGEREGVREDDRDAEETAPFSSGFDVGWG